MFFRFKTVKDKNLNKDYVPNCKSVTKFRFYPLNGTYIFANIESLL